MVTECLAAKTGCTVPFLSLTKAKQENCGKAAAVLLYITDCVFFLHIDFWGYIIRIAVRPWDYRVEHSYLTIPVLYFCDLLV